MWWCGDVDWLYWSAVVKREPSVEVKLCSYAAVTKRMRYKCSRLTVSQFWQDWTDNWSQWSCLLESVFTAGNHKNSSCTVLLLISNISFKNCYDELTIRGLSCHICQISSDDVSSGHTFFFPRLRQCQTQKNVMNTFLFIPNKLQTASCKQKKMNDCLM